MFAPSGQQLARRGLGAGGGRGILDQQGEPVVADLEQAHLRRLQQGAAEGRLLPRQRQQQADPGAGLGRRPGQGLVLRLGRGGLAWRGAAAVHCSARSRRPR